MFLTAETLPILVLAECVVELLACWSLCTVILWTLVRWLAVFFVQYLTYWYTNKVMHLSLQDGSTALMMASEVECVKMLMDRGAKVNMQNKVSGVIHYVHAMHHKLRVPCCEWW